ncbi:MAG: alginate O-acetyltransferase AlgX-related protein [Planctomycetota bacterium]
MPKPTGRERGVAAVLLLLFSAFGVYLLRKEWDSLSTAVYLWNAMTLAVAATGAFFSLQWFRLRIRLRGARRRRTWALWGVALVTLPGFIAIVFHEPHPRYALRGTFLLLFLLMLVGLSTVRLGGWLREVMNGRLGRVLVLLYVNGLVALIALEVGLRVLGMLSPNPILSPPNLKAEKRIRDHILKPHQVHQGFAANALGFYDQAFDATTKRGARVLACADSFGVETVPYSQNFLTRLETEELEVYNLGVDGISPAGYLYLLEEHFTRFQADYALICLFLGNDITGLPSKPPSMAWLRPDFWYLGFVPPRIMTLVAERERMSGAGQEGRSQEAAVGVEGVGEGSVGRTVESPTFSREAFLRIETERARVCLRPGLDEEIDRQFGQLRDILQTMKARTKGRLGVVLIPDEFQVNDVLWGEVVVRTTMTERSGLDREGPNRRVREICQALGIDSLDLLPTLKPIGERAYHCQDTHWNAQGHRVAAEAIRPWLAKQVEKIQSTSKEGE